MVIGAACLAVALAAAGCGGHTVTKKDVVARANGICITALHSMREVPPPAGTAGLADYLAEVVPMIEKEAKDTEALPRPAQGPRRPGPLRDRRERHRDRLPPTGDGGQERRRRGGFARARHPPRQPRAGARGAVRADPLQCLGGHRGLVMRRLWVAFST